MMPFIIPLSYGVELFLLVPPWANGIIVYGVVCVMEVLCHIGPSLFDSYLV